MKASVVVVVAPSTAQSFAGTETKRGETIELTAERRTRQDEDAEGAHNEGSEAAPGARGNLQQTGGVQVGDSALTAARRDASPRSPSSSSSSSQKLRQDKAGG